MKKFLSVLLALISVICVAFAFVGCKEEQGIGVFYTLTEAYEKGHLTREDIVSIAYYHNGGRVFNESVMSEDYSPISKTPEKPSTATEKAIKDTFYNSDMWNEFKNYYSYEDISCRYFGIYGNAIALKIGVKGGAVSDVYWFEEVDGLKIEYRNEVRIFVWIND